MTASAAALVLLGVVVGRSSVGGSGGAVPIARPDAPVRGSTEAEAALGPNFSIPTSFTGLATEWRTETGGTADAGYAILFEPQSRRMIVDRCLHRGYFDLAANRPVEPGEFCKTVLSGSLSSLEEKEAKVTTRDGASVDASLALVEDSGVKRLRIAFGDHEMLLVPGSKNDLFQEIERTPRIEEQKRRQFEYAEAEYQKQRRAQQARAEANDELPKD